MPKCSEQGLRSNEGRRSAIYERFLGPADHAAFNSARLDGVTWPKLQMISMGEADATPVIGENFPKIDRPKH